jgi:hypothetical protein
MTLESLFTFVRNPRSPWTVTLRSA